MGLEEPARVGENTAPDPGLYPGIDFDVYASWDAVNQTLLNRFNNRTPAHVLHDLQTGGKTTPALELGWLAHLATFEPDRYSDQVVAAPVLDLRTKKGKKVWADLHGENPDRLVVRYDDDRKALEMAKSVRAHPTAGLFLRSKGANEVSCVWVDEEHEVKCKSRLDRYSYLNEWPVVADLKSARSANRREFERSILNFGYDLQAAHYLAGVEAIHPIKIGDPFRRFIFIVVESSPPFLCAVYELDDDSLEEGARKRSIYIHKWRECLESGKWPGYSDGIEDARLPAYAFKAWPDY